LTLFTSLALLCSSVFASPYQPRGDLVDVAARIENAPNNPPVMAVTVVQRRDDDLLVANVQRRGCGVYYNRGGSDELVKVEDTE
ncbi:hypothetical protein K503DRAFT_774062, partial [Rhizopogon vinicolor AM-OR11-026]